MSTSVPSTPSTGSSASPIVLAQPSQSMAGTRYVRSLLIRLLPGSEGRRPSTAPSPGGRDGVLRPVYRVPAAILVALMALSCAADAPVARLPTVAPKPLPPHLVGS